MTFSSFPTPDSDQSAAALPPLSQPLYGATFTQAIHRYFAKYTTFKGFASRSEYWWVILALFVIGIVISIIGLIAGNTVEMILQLVVFVVTVVPSLALGWRRLHDAGFAGPWFLLGIIPVIGTIAVLVMVLMPTRPDKHKDVWADPHAVKQ